MKSYKIITIFSFLVVFAVFKLWLRVSAIKMKLDIRNLGKEFVLMDSEVQRLKAEYYKISSPASIEQVVKEKLSMRYPRKNEVIKLVIK